MAKSGKARTGEDNFKGISANSAIWVVLLAPYFSHQAQKNLECARPSVQELCRNTEIRETESLKVARDGIEPPTRGFSVRCSTS
jgi:hypothetical protein